MGKRDDLRRLRRRVELEIELANEPMLLESKLQLISHSLEWYEEEKDGN